MVLVFAACTSLRDSNDEVPNRVLTEDGAWCWFSDPRAIYYQGEFKRTYTGWVDSSGSIVVAYFDHDSGEMSRHILHNQLERDDHDNPAFLMDPEGKLMIFYSKHSRHQPALLARATRPERIDSWESPQPLNLNDSITYAGFSDTYTYSNVVRLSDEDNKLYLFWRGSDFKPNYSTSSDYGRTWETGRILVLPERTYRNRRPYMKVHANGRDAIHFAFTDGHPNAEPTNSIYYMKYRDGALLRANGERIATLSDGPVDPAKTDLVYNGNEPSGKAWIWDIAETAQGQPVIVFVAFPTDSSHVYYYSIFNEGKWNNYRLIDSGGWFPHTREGAKEREPNYSGGIVLDHNDPSQVYLSRTKNGVFEIERWYTNDLGKTWNSAEITRNSQHDNVRPYVAQNHPADSTIILWMNARQYIHYTDYESGIMMAVIPTQGMRETSHK